MNRYEKIIFAIGYFILFVCVCSSCYCVYSAATYEPTLKVEVKAPEVKPLVLESTIEVEDPNIYEGKILITGAGVEATIYEGLFQIDFNNDGTVDIAATDAIRVEGQTNKCDD